MIIFGYSKMVFKTTKKGIYKIWEEKAGSVFVYVIN